MGDFLDDYLDGLSSGMQRYNPLPTGPYNGTKHKRQWHLLADSEREQAIFEARMREEEESASASAEGASAEGGSAPIPEKLILDRRFVPDVAQGVFAPPPPEPVTLTTESYPTEGALDLTTGAVEYPTQTQAETFGTTTSPDGSVNTMEDQLTGAVNTDISVIVTDAYSIQQQDPTLLETIAADAQPNDAIAAINSTGSGYVFLVGGNEWGDYPGYFDWMTGFAQPAYAIGGKYAVVFRSLIDFNYYASLNLSSIFYITAFPVYNDKTNVYFDSGYGEKLLIPELTAEDPNLNQYYYLYVDINTTETTQQIIENIEASYQSQGDIKYWSYGIVEIDGNVGDSV
jgi:hypothetical protein